jgi:hypothetical protein
MYDMIYWMCMIRFIECGIYCMWKLLWSVIRLMIDDKIDEIDDDKIYCMCMTRFIVYVW